MPPLAHSMFMQSKISEFKFIYIQIQLLLMLTSLSWSSSSASVSSASSPTPTSFVIHSHRTPLNTFRNAHKMITIIIISTTGYATCSITQMATLFYIYIRIGYCECDRNSSNPSIFIFHTSGFN